jgi:hypothetical protein
MMTETAIPTFSQLSDTSRVWIFQSSKVLSDQWAQLISTELTSFLQDWAAHGKDLFASVEIRFNRFIIIAVDENMAGATGCSIDKMMKEIQSIDLKFNLNLLERMKVAYRDSEEISEVSVNEFAAMLKSGKATENTMVFNNTVQSISELKTNWEMPVSQCWVANLL